jgi:membrane associated rhomboid family serine protease
LGAAFVILRQRGINPFQTWIGGILIINLLFTFSIPNISIGGHLGGLVGGALAALAITFGEQRRSPWLALAGVVAIGVFAFTASLAAAQLPGA